MSSLKGLCGITVTVYTLAPFAGNDPPEETQVMMHAY